MNKLLLFILGISAAFAALIIQTLLVILFPSLVDLASLEKIGYLMMIAVLTEEILKFALIWKIFNNFKEQISIFTSALVLGFGFATTEIILNLFNNPLLTSELFFSYLGLLLIHLLTAAFYGCYFSQKGKVILWQSAPIFGIGLLIHALFNLGVFYGMSIILLNSILIIVLILLIKTSFLPKQEK